MVREAPGPGRWPVLGNLPALALDPLGFVANLAREYGDYAAFSIGGRRYLLVSHPDGIRRVAVERHRNYVKGPGYDGVKLVLGEGLITSEGETWRRHRRLAQPAFHAGCLAGMAPIIEEEAQQAAQILAAEAGSVVDVHAHTIRFTLRVLGRVLFGVGLPEALIREVTPILSSFANDYSNEPFHLPLWTPFPSHVRFRGALRRLDEAVAGLIAARRGAAPAPDLLGALMGAREGGEALSDRELRDEVVTMLLAGHETTAGALAFALHDLGQSPDEADRIAADPGRAAAAFSETLRLRPPAWLVERCALEDDVVGGFAVPAGSLIAIAPWVIHRDPRWWPDPEAFRCERFLGSPPAPYTYLPYLAGPRVCIGQHLAGQEGAIFLSTALRACRLEPTGPLALEAAVTLRPKGGVRMRVTRRIA